MLGATLHLLLKTHVLLIKSAFPIYTICTLSELRFLHIAPLQEEGEVLIGTPSLTGARGQRAGGQRVARMATVGAETSVEATTTLLHGKCTLETPGTVHIHGLGATRRGLVARRGGWKG